MKKILFILIALSLIFACSKKSDTSSQNNNTTNNSNNNNNTNQNTCTSPTRADLEKIQIFPSDNPLNTDISSSPVDANSSAIISAIGAVGLHPDFGAATWQGAPIGIPFSVVCGNQTKVPITFRANSYDGNYGTESDPGPYPIPLNAQIEGNGSGDSHVLAVDIDNKILYELYNASQSGTGWQASSGAVFDLKTNAARPSGWTSADAAGLPILPCLVRYDEVASGKISHCIRFTLTKANVYNGYVAPAGHKVSGTGALGTSLPMGARLRLKASFNIIAYPADDQVILKAMQTYGLILADIGSNMFISGAPDSRWNDNDLALLKNVKSTDFEVIQIGVIK